MASTGRQIFDDGLDRVERIDSSALTLEDVRAWVRGTGFEGMIRNVERSWKAYRERHPERMGAPDDPLSLAAYERSIRRWIRKLRGVLKRAPEQEPAVCLALHLGTLIADGAWRANRGALTRSGLKRRVHARQAAQRSAVARRVARRQGDTRIRDLWHALRAKHPHDHAHSQTWASREIGRKLNRNPETVRSTLKKLGLR